MLHSWCSETVTVVRAPLVSARGSESRDWANAERVPLPGCSVQPAATSRDMRGRTLQTTDQWTLYAPPGADVQVGDRVEFEGRTFEVDGVPHVWKSPTGRVTHVQAQLVEWKG